MLEIIITMTIKVGCRREGYQLPGLNREEITIDQVQLQHKILSEKSF